MIRRVLTAQDPVLMCGTCMDARGLATGGDIIGSVEVDQSALSYLEQFDMLAGRNAQAVSQEMEWE